VEIWKFTEHPLAITTEIDDVQTVKIGGDVSRLYVQVVEIGLNPSRI
jgi:hypothetical protein